MKDWNTKRSHGTSVGQREYLEFQEEPFAPVQQVQSNKGLVHHTGDTIFHIRTFL